MKSFSQNVEDLEMNEKAYQGNFNHKYKLKKKNNLQHEKITTYLLKNEDFSNSGILQFSGCHRYPS